MKEKKKERKKTDRDKERNGKKEVDIVKERRWKSQRHRGNDRFRDRGRCTYRDR